MKESATTSEGIPRSETLIGKSVIKSEEVLNIEDKQDGNDNKIKSEMQPLKSLLKTSNDDFEQLKSEVQESVPLVLTEKDILKSTKVNVVEDDSKIVKDSQVNFQENSVTEEPRIEGQFDESLAEPLPDVKPDFDFSRFQPPLNKDSISGSNSDISHSLNKDSISSSSADISVNADENSSRELPMEMMMSANVKVTANEDKADHEELKTTDENSHRNLTEIPKEQIKQSTEEIFHDQENVTITNMNENNSVVDDEIDFTTTTTTHEKIQLKSDENVKLEETSVHQDQFPNFKADVKKVLPQLNQENIDSEKIEVQSDIPDDGASQDLPSQNGQNENLKVETLKSLRDVSDLNSNTESINNEPVENLQVKLNLQDENCHIEDQSRTTNEIIPAFSEQETVTFQEFDSEKAFPILDQGTGIKIDPFKVSSLENVPNTEHTEMDMESDPCKESNLDFNKWNQDDSGNSNDSFEGSTLEDLPKLNQDGMESGYKADPFEGHFNEVESDHANKDLGLKTDQESYQKNSPNWNKAENMNSGIQNDPFSESKLENFRKIDHANMDSGIKSDPFAKANNQENLSKWNQDETDSVVKDDPFAGSDPFNEDNSNGISNTDPWQTDEVNKINYIYISRFLTAASCPKKDFYNPPPPKKKCATDFCTAYSK